MRRGRRPRAGQLARVSSNGERHMTWVRINGHRYYRRSRRVDGRVVTEHVGRGRIAELEAQLDADLRKLRRLDRAVERLDFDGFIWGIREVLAVDRVLADVV